jgi:ATP-dependent RNA helicase DDX24/MAK5
VIDEADRMMERGHFQELRDLLERMDLSKARRQTLVFSATLSLVHDAPKRLSYKKQQKGKKQKSNLKQTPGQKLNELIDLLGMKNPKVKTICSHRRKIHWILIISCHDEFPELC